MKQLLILIVLGAAAVGGYLVLNSPAPQETAPEAPQADSEESSTAPEAAEESAAPVEQAVEEAAEAVEEAVENGAEAAGAAVDAAQEAVPLLKPQKVRWTRFRIPPALQLRQQAMRPRRLQRPRLTPLAMLWKGLWMRLREPLMRCRKAQQMPCPMLSKGPLAPSRVCWSSPARPQLIRLPAATDRRPQKHQRARLPVFRRPGLLLLMCRLMRPGLRLLRKAGDVLQRV